MLKNMQKQQLGLRAINMKMKGSVHKQKTFADPKIGKRSVFLVLSVMTFITDMKIITVT